MAILQIRDVDGNIIDIPFLKGNKGANGITPHIGENGNWWIGNEDTGTKAGGNVWTDGGEPPEGYDFQIDPDGDVLELGDGLKIDGNKLCVDLDGIDIPTGGGGWKPLDTFDLSSGAVSYSTDTMGCVEIMLITTEALVATAIGHSWKKANGVSSGAASVPKTIGGVVILSYLGDGLIAVSTPRENDTFLRSSLCSYADDSDTSLVVTCSSATSGIIKVYGR